MRLADAPPAGWYPDPTGGSRLRWWDGTDWSEHHRAPPTASQLDIEAHHQQPAVEGPPRPAPTGQPRSEGIGLSRRDADEIIAEVRQAARAEVNRAADLFSVRAQAATKQIQPLISEYTNKLKRWFRVALIVIPLLVVAWFVFEAVAQASFLDWIGERIDRLTD